MVWLDHHLAEAGSRRVLSMLTSAWALSGRLWWVDALIADDETDWKRGWRVVGAEPVTD